MPDDRTNESEPAAAPQAAKLDRVSAAMAALTVLALIAFLGFRYGSSIRGKSLAVGDPAPFSVVLIDLDSSEPLLVLGLKEKVVWIVFWSAQAADVPHSLAAIARALSTIRAHRKFSMFAAAVGASKPERVRAAAAEAGGELPVDLASAETSRRFWRHEADPPLHVLIDENGQVIAMGEAGSSTLDRLADQVESPPRRARPTRHHPFRVPTASDQVNRRATDVTTHVRRDRRDHARECVVQTGRKSSNLGRKPDLLRQAVTPAR